jgi:hypothetical protein
MWSSVSLYLYSQTIYQNNMKLKVVHKIRLFPDL